MENTRFHPGEKANDPDFAARLASLAEIYVNDAFGTAHRAHHLPAAAGFLLARELEALERIRERPQHPLMIIFGGAKISGKIGVLKQFIERAELILIGGGMANTFCKAQGLEVGKSLVEEDKLEIARDILQEAIDKLVLPVDVVIAREVKADAERRTVSINDVPPGWHILDIGPKSIDLFRFKLHPAKTAVWNGPLGVFEIDPFGEGTFNWTLDNSNQAQSKLG